MYMHAYQSGGNLTLNTGMILNITMTDLILHLVLIPLINRPEVLGEGLVVVISAPALSHASNGSKWDVQ